MGQMTRDPRLRLPEEDFSPSLVQLRRSRILTPDMVSALQVLVELVSTNENPPTSALQLIAEFVVSTTAAIEVDVTGVSAVGKMGDVGIQTSSSIRASGLRATGRIGSIIPPPVMYLEPWAAVPGYRSKTIPSYLYIQYDDDDDLQAFVASYNRMAQEYVSWFAEVNLPVYTGLTGQLLDWVSSGLYGQSRPLLPSGRNSNLGPLNTFAFNVLPFNGRKKIEPTNFYATTDDVFKRIITWNFFKGDGRTFSVRWLKRRIMRFLAGENGVNFNVDNTYQISVSFGIHPQVNIRILNGVRNLLGGAIPNRCAFNTKRLNQLDTEFVSFAPLTYAPILQAAINSGAVQLPFQYDWVVTIEGGS